MSFVLQVRFTGLCMHVHNQQRGEVAVLLPDARFKKRDEFHADETLGVPHAGYLRADLANVGLRNSAASIPPAAQTEPEPPGMALPDDSPFFEIVYRFKQQTLDFGLPATKDSIVVDTRLPDFGDIAPSLQLRQNLFRAPASPLLDSPVLMRTILRGGVLSGARATTSETWSIDRRLNDPNAAPLVGVFPGEVVWTRQVENADGLLITMTDFDGQNAVKLPLDALGGLIRVKIANLCSDNVLEWDQLYVRRADLEDSDFKWLYRFVEPAPSTTMTTLLNGLLLPAPRLLSQMPQQRGGPPYDCLGATIRAEFPPFEDWTMP